MALTKDQIIERLATRVVHKIRPTIVWGDLVSAIASSTSAEKDAIVEAIRNKSPSVIGDIIVKIMEVDIKNKAKTNVTQALANNSLNIDELSDILE